MVFFFVVENLGILKISSTVSGALAGGAASSGVKALAMLSTCSLNMLNASSEGAVSVPATTDKKWRNCLRRRSSYKKMPNLLMASNCFTLSKVELEDGVGAATGTVRGAVSFGR